MTDSLDTLLAHAERQRDGAQAALWQAEKAARALQAQATQLSRYREETLGRHPASGGRSASIELLRCHEAFVKRLDHALDQQQTQMRAAEARILALRGELMALEIRFASVRKLSERRGAEVDRHAQRQDQRRSDDAAQRRRIDDSTAAWPSATLPATT